MARLMLEKGWNKSELARVLHISPASYNAIEQGGGVSFQTAVRLADVLGQGVVELIGEAGDPDPSGSRYELISKAARMMAEADALDMKLFNEIAESLRFDENEGITAEQFYRAAMGAYRAANARQVVRPDTSDIDEAPKGRGKRGTG